MILTIHVGLPKCASTSLQAALFDCNFVLFPRNGLHHFEHIAIPLKLKGIDKWTSQWIAEDWVDCAYQSLISEIKNSGHQHIIVSSERLADVSLELLDRFIAEFSGVKINILYLYRPVDSYISSVWKHAVFRHDLSVDFETFKKSFNGFDPIKIASNFSERYETHLIDISRPDWTGLLEDILGVVPDIQNENISAPFEACYFLQKIHQSIGTEKYKSYFNAQRKQEIAELFMGECESKLEPFDVPIIRGLEGK